jgi:hypothetical protein
MGRFHVPIKYSKAVHALIETLESYGQPVGATDLIITGKNQDALMGMFELNGVQGEGYDRAAAQFAFRMSEMQKVSWQGWLGEKMMVCTNLLIQGGQKLLQHKHTIGLKLRELLDYGVKKILGLREELRNTRNRLKNTNLSVDGAKAHIIDMVRQDVLPQNKVRYVADTYFQAAPGGEAAPEVRHNFGNAWGLVNTVTRAFRDLGPNALIDRTAALANYWRF